ncbi:MAG: hypothetical protein ACRYHQ_30020 [Janthinobacterium lividum]
MDTGPVLTAVLEGFRRGRAEGKSVSDYVSAAIAAAGELAPALAPAPVTPAPLMRLPAPGHPIPDALATDYGPMLEAGGSVALVGRADTAPVLPQGAADMDVLALLTQWRSRRAGPRQRHGLGPCRSIRTRRRND